MALLFKLAAWLSLSLFSAFSIITLGEQQKQLPNGESRTLLRIDEQITIAALNQQYHNQYWLEPSTGAVIASEQQLAPGTHRYALAVAKSYLNQGGI